MQHRTPGRPKKEGEKKESFHLSLYPSQIKEYLRQMEEAGYTNRNEYLIQKLRLNK